MSNNQVKPVIIRAHLLLETVNLASHHSTIGGSVAGAANTIADNGVGDVFVSSGSGNSIRHNALYHHPACGPFAKNSRALSYHWWARTLGL
jgi:hypothetical protein